MLLFEDNHTNSSSTSSSSNSSPRSDENVYDIIFLPKHVKFLDDSRVSKFICLIYILLFFFSSQFLFHHLLEILPHLTVKLFVRQFLNLIVLLKKILKIFKQNVIVRVELNRQILDMDINIDPVLSIVVGIFEHHLGRQ